MRSKVSKLTGASALVLVVFLASVAFADVLWDQSTLLPEAPGLANSDSPGFGGFTIHTVDDVTVDGVQWSVDSITEYYSSWNLDWLNITEGYLHVFPKTGPLPTEDPGLSAVVPMSAVQINGDVIAVTASDLGLVLEPGEYWLGLTPVAPAGVFGANLQYATTVVGEDAASYDTMFPGWTNLYPGYDGAILVEGSAVVPTDAASWGDIKSLFR